METTAESFLSSLNPFGVDLGLERMSKLLCALGNPQNAFRCVQVAGTNGKGSAASTLDAILRAAGHRCGLYTSPHLVHVNERIRVEGKVIGDADFSESIFSVRDAMVRHAIRATYFEVLTAAALDRFRRDGLEIAVLEVGLGGRLDATTAVLPEIEIITRVGLDHTEILGKTIQRIAAEKAEVIRSNSSVFIARQIPDALNVFLRKAGEVGASSFCAQRDFRISFAEEDSENSLPRRSFVRKGTKSVEDSVIPESYYFRNDVDGFFVDDLSLALRGAHQLDNAEVAVAAARHLSSHVDAAAIRRGLSEVKWPGRFQKVSAFPDVFVDGAHNADGADALASLVKSRTSGSLGKKVLPPQLIFSVLKDKDTSAVAEKLFECCSRVHLVVLSDNPRALPMENLVELARRAGVHFTCHQTVESALKAAREDALRDGPRGWVLAAGSLFLVGRILEFF